MLKIFLSGVVLALAIVILLPAAHAQAPTPTASTINYNVLVPCYANGAVACIGKNIWIRVCPLGTYTSACTAPATIYTDVYSTASAPNPFQADTFANYTAFVAPGYYTVQQVTDNTLTATVLHSYTAQAGSVGGGGGGNGFGTTATTTVQAAITTATTTGQPPVVVPSGFTGSQTFTNPPPTVPIINLTQSPNGDYDKNGVQPVDIFGVKHDGQAPACNIIAGNPQVSCFTQVNPFTKADIGKLVILYGAGPSGPTYGGVVSGTVTASGGTGGTNGVQPLISNNGGCTYPMRGWVTVTGGAASGAVTIWKPGYGCTSLPTTATVSTVTGNVTLSGVAYLNVDLPTTIVSVQNSNTITVADTPTVTTGGENILYGSDDSAALMAACNGHLLPQNGGHYTHTGISLISQGVVCDGNNTWIQGAGWAPLANSGGGSNIVYAGKNPNGADGIWITSGGWGAKLTDMGLRGNSWARPRGLVISEGIYGRGNANSAEGEYDRLWIGWMWGDNVGIDTGGAQIGEGIFADVATGNGDFNNFSDVHLAGVVHGIDGNNDQATAWTFDKNLQIEDSYIGICAFNGMTVNLYYTEFNDTDIVLAPCVAGGGADVSLTIDTYGGESSARNITYGTLGAAPQAPTLIIHNAGIGQPYYYEDPSNVTIDFSQVFTNATITLGDGVSGFGFGGSAFGERPAQIKLPVTYGGELPGNFNFYGIAPEQITPYPYTSDLCGSLCNNRVQNGFKLNGNTVYYNFQDYATTPIPWQQNDFLGTVRDFGSVQIKSPRPLGQTDAASPSAAFYGWGPPGVTGTPGTTTYNYISTCSDQAGNETSGPNKAQGYGWDFLTQYGVEVRTTTGPATLNGTNYVTINALWLNRGCAYYNFYGDEGSGNIGYLTTIPSYQFSGTFTDQGQFTKNTGRVPPLLSQVSQSGGLTVEGPTTLSRLNNTVYVDGNVFTTVQAAINALPTTGGTVLVPCGTYVGPTSIPTGTHIVATQCPLPTSLESILDSATALNTVKFTYTANQTFSNVRDIALDGIVFDFGGTGGLTLDGIGWSHFDMGVVHCASSGPCLTLAGTTTNFSANDFERLYTYGGSESLKLVGSGSAFVTDNHFKTLFLGSPNNGSSVGTFIDFAKWTDSNTFDFTNFFNVNQGTSASVTGIVFNSDAPTSERGVYNQHFLHIDLNSCTYNSSTAPNCLNAATSTFFVMNLAHGIDVNVGVAVPMVNGNGSPSTTLNSACTSTANCTLNLVSRENGDSYAGISHRDYKILNVGTIGPTGAAVGSTANLVGTWSTPWPDTNYAVVCSPQGTQAGIPVLEVQAQTTTTVTLVITAASNVAASFQGVKCIGQHYMNPAY